MIQAPEYTLMLQNILGEAAHGMESAECYINWTSLAAQVPVCFQLPSPGHDLINGCMVVQSRPPYS